MLLQTARTTIHNPSDPQFSIKVRFLFDSGGQKSYVNEQATTLAAGIGTHMRATTLDCYLWIQQRAKVCKIVNAGMCLRGYPPMLVSLYVVPTICDPLVGQPIATCIEKTSSFKGLDFADYSDGKSALQVDVLIGSDYYWEQVTGSVCRSADPQPFILSWAGCCRVPLKQPAPYNAR